MKVSSGLTDKNSHPDDTLVFSVTGDKVILWKNLIDQAKSSYKDIKGEWRFYNDGKQWLYKLTLRHKTIFWASVFNDTFRITFYFTEKAEPLISGSDLPSEIKDGFASLKSQHKLRPITVILNNDSDAENILRLIALKKNFK